MSTPNKFSEYLTFSKEDLKKSGIKLKWPFEGGLYLNDKEVRNSQDLLGLLKRYPKQRFTLRARNSAWHIAGTIPGWGLVTAHHIEYDIEGSKLRGIAFYSDITYKTKRPWWKFWRPRLKQVYVYYVE